MGNPLNASYIPKQQNVGNEKSSTPILHFEDPNFSVFARQRSRRNNHRPSNSTVVTSGQRPCHNPAKYVGTLTAVNINLLWITTTAGEFVEASVSLYFVWSVLIGLEHPFTRPFN